MMISNVFGSIAAEILDYGKVELEETIAEEGPDRGVPRGALDYMCAGALAPALLRYCRKARLIELLQGLAQPERWKLRQGTSSLRFAS